MVVTSDREGCLLCHGEIIGFAPGHDPSVIGCASCHLGDPDATLADPAHQGMVRIPGNLYLVCNLGHLGRGRRLLVLSR